MLQQRFTFFPTSDAKSKRPGAIMATLRKRNGIEPDNRSNTVAAAQLPISGFGGGTLIETDGGPIPVDWLRPGDRVLTFDDGLQPLRWVGRDCLRQQPQEVATACV